MAFLEGERLRNRGIPVRLPFPVCCAFEDTKTHQRTTLGLPLTLYPESGPTGTQGSYHFSPWPIRRHKWRLWLAPPQWVSPWNPRSLAARRGEHSITPSELRSHQMPSDPITSLYTVLNTYLCSPQTRHESLRHSAPACQRGCYHLKQLDGPNRTISFTVHLCPYIIMGF